MANMRKERALWFYRLHDLQRLLDRRMRGMWLIAKRIQKKDVEVVELLQRFDGALPVIGQVSARAETEADDRGLAMNHCQRLKARPEQFDRPVDRLQVNLRQSAKFILSFKNVAKHVAQKIAGGRRGIEREFARLVLISQGAEVVDSQDVVGVRVRVEHGIELRDVFAQRLFAEVRSAVDHYMPAVVADHHRGASAPVARIRRTAYRAITANRRYAHRRAAAQYRQSRLHQPFVPVMGPGACGERASALVTST